MSYSPLMKSNLVQNPWQYAFSWCSRCTLSEGSVTKGMWKCISFSMSQVFRFSFYFRYWGIFLNVSISRLSLKSNGFGRGGAFDLKKRSIIIFRNVPVVNLAIFSLNSICLAEETFAFHSGYYSPSSSPPLISLLGSDFIYWVFTNNASRSLFSLYNLIASVSRFKLSLWTMSCLRLRGTPTEIRSAVDAALQRPFEIDSTDLLSSGDRFTDALKYLYRSSFL